MMGSQINVKSAAVNIGAVLYFLALIIVNQAGGAVISALWFFSIGFAAFAGLYAINFRIRLHHILFMLLIAATGALNIIQIGTTSVRNQALIIVFFVVSFALSSDRMNEKYLKPIIYINILVVIYKFFTVGFSGQIYTNASSNFVSIYLMYPTVVYYCLAERNKRKISMIPVTLVWIICLMSRGRGGIIAATLFLLGMVWITFDRSKGYKRLLFIMAGILIVSIAFLNIERILNAINSSVISEYFRARGLSSSRTYYWKDYLEKLSDPKQLIFGVDLTKTLAGIELEGNVHNSFLNIHLHNGLIMLAIIVILILNRIRRCIKDREKVFLVCMTVMLIRAFTDIAFWPAYGTPVLFFLLLCRKKQNSEYNIIPDLI